MARSRTSRVASALSGRWTTAVSGARALAWRALGDPGDGGLAPDGVPTSSAAAPGPPATGATSSNPYRALRKVGLRVERGLVVRGPGGRVTVRFEAPVQINNDALALYRDFTIGRYSYFRSGIVRHVDQIGRYTSIGPNVILGESEHPTTWLSSSPAVFQRDRYIFYPPEADAGDRVVKRTTDNVSASAADLVTIGHDVWIGANVTVRRGVTIADGAIIGSGAFVNRDVPPYAIVAGLPARELGMRFDDDTVARLREFKWWEFDVADLAGVDFSDVHAAIDAIGEREKAGTVRRIKPAYSTVTLGNRAYTKLKRNAAERTRATKRVAARTPRGGRGGTERR